MVILVNTTAVNLYCQVIDLLTDVGKKFFNSTFKGLNEKYKEGAIEILLFLKKVKIEGKYLALL